MPDEGLEDAVKGIFQEIAGKAKEVTGETIEDPKLAKRGLVQKVRGRLRRRGIEAADRREQDRATDT